MTQAAPQAPTEYQIKAAFLYNFVKFVEWPPETLPSNGAPIVLAVLGKDPFGSALDDVILGKVVEDDVILIIASRGC